MLNLIFDQMHGEVVFVMGDVGTFVTF